MLLVAGIGMTSGAAQFGPIGPAHGPLHHAPVHHDPYVKVPPRPFAYEYGVQVGHKLRTQLGISTTQLPVIMFTLTSVTCP